ncbi:unnamed protein product, partial (mitochondrion) [Musa acuminata var. zebrina]
MRNEGDESEYEYNKKRQKFDSRKQWRVALFVHRKRGVWNYLESWVLAKGNPPLSLFLARPILKPQSPNTGLVYNYAITTYLP